ncbi:hypothetical protein FH972_021676 [Carpinus fangiana]|uniref:Glucosidase 2 subunit beta n=1 Tax=Carpinus fangiana TaxID=176857 RepID=A0A5N6KS49_9ROSI|nr:hypothetical protein FH972_021676 [Carpinus fangiana]
MKPESTLALLLIALSSAGSAANVDSKLRGVGPDFLKFYDTAADTFTCISHPSLTIPASRVNDDFCDCPDGSDEPGTAACAHLSPLSPPSVGNVAKDINSTPALPGFYCQNKGHNPQYIPFTHVNDGICDYDLCCDGSDEYAGAGGIKCENKCKQIGNEWRRLDNIRQQSTSNAIKKRAQLVTEAQKLRREAEDWLRDSKGKLESLEVKVKNLEQEKNDIERREKGKMVGGTSSSGGGKVGVLAGLAKTRLDEVKNSLDKVRKQSNVYKSRIDELEGILTAFKTDYNPNFNDEGVKRAVRAWDDYAARDQPTFVDPTTDADISDVLTDATHGIEWDQFQGGDDPSDIDVLYQFEAYLPAPLRDWLDQQLRSLKIMLIENGILAAPSEMAAGESKAVIEARSRLDAVQREFDDLKRQKDEKEKALSDDFGADDIFRALQDKCVQKDSGEYTYELCWLKEVTQISKKGGSRNGMGRFEKFDTTYSDEDVTADGKGLGTGERVVLKYTEGAHCWQGPDRSTTVVLACAENEEIWKIMEEEKCVYRMEAGTPAVCTGNAATGGDSAKVKKEKDEL